MIEVINDYHINYWFRNKIIDCSEISRELQLDLKPQEAEAIDEISLEDLEDYLKSSEYNEPKKEYEDTNVQSIQYEEDYSNISIARLPNRKITKITKVIKQINNPKREKKELPQTTRMVEFSLRKRKVLLDKFSKPKI